MTSATREDSNGLGNVDRTYWRDVTRYNILGPAEELALTRQARNGDDKARDRLITANLRFVISVARRYTGRGLTLMELVSEGNAGLLEAVLRFDQTRGTRFITYAVWWIRQAINLALAQAGKAVRVPVHRMYDQRQLMRRVGKLSQGLGRDPTLEELVEHTGISRGRVSRALDEAQRDFSLDTSPDLEGDDHLRPFLAAADASVEEQLEKKLMVEAAEGSLEALSTRERRIIIEYYGLRDCSPMTLAQIGERLGLTRERVRQLRNRALGKIRQHYGGALMEFASN